ncbi:MAG: hypothetical protein ACJ748_17320 [Flavisolibacter sp.]
MNRAEIHTYEQKELQISDLENLYAEALKDEMDIHTLNRIWTRIKLLKQQWDKQKKWDCLTSI